MSRSPVGVPGAALDRVSVTAGTVAVSVVLYFLLWGVALAAGHGDAFWTISHLEGVLGSGVVLLAGFLLHAGLEHVGWNAVSLLAAGTLVEPGVRSRRYVAGVVACGWATTVLPGFLGGGFAVGLSGVVNALWAMVALGSAERTVDGRPRTRLTGAALFFVAVFVLWASLVAVGPGASIRGHALGVVFGAGWYAVERRGTV